MYEPELGQTLFGNPVGEYDVPEFARALLRGIMREIERVYWNIHQKNWDGTTDPGIPGLTIRPYWWGECECENECTCEASLPNLECGGLELRWYKYFGRGMSTTRTWSTTEWAQWYAETLELVRKQDVTYD